MITRYATNLKVAKEMFDAAQPKLKGDEGMKQAFEQFNLQPELVKVVGAAEAAAAGLLGLSIFSKRFSQLGSIITLGVMGVAITKHLQAGHGKEGAQHAIDVAQLAGLSLVDTFTSKK
ncbi:MULTISPECIES: DoxX family protein [unclassified Staphylococcus]|uniref:DoxX family protein n=1 Tax=unclassified Staphylococcus TaxID=91994 RepID=UPI0021D353F6|nr:MULTISPECIES: DoxX family protein [unclassified Staphylococcus]UXR69308.1 DoxX family protein [Staphylococcus sp. IVB6246]UXR75954.1 DoxX family protein [Staphylococcus sp. IVB6233]UXR80151.1 DoxX family protein [Staphylococcus sp. IVB6218]